MSWSASFEFVDGNVVEESVGESNIEPGYHNDQYEVALDTVWKLIDSGVVGDVNGNFKVNITGHGNEGHVPTAGWANDFVSVTVYQT